MIGFPQLDHVLSLDNNSLYVGWGGPAGVKFTLDVNKLFNDAVAALHSGLAPWIVFGLVALVMSPWIIPAASRAIAEQRALSHKREIGLQKIRNNISDRAKRRPRDGG